MENQHQVYFELSGLTSDLKKRLENHFKVRRKSGGGECGPVTSVSRTVFSIAFKHKEDQQRVLQRPQQVLELPGGGSLTLTVHEAPPSSVTPIQDPQEQTQPPSNASNSPPRVEEYEVKLESYLLRYLKEFPEAQEKLKVKLTAAGCSDPRYLEETRVLVRRLAQAGAPETDRSWKAKVDEIFDAYEFHFVTEPRMVKALLQSHNNATDEVAVYREPGMATVVGEKSKVKAKLAALETELRAAEKRVKVRRLCAAKLRLLWPQIKWSVGEKVPGIRICQKDAEHIVLEGSTEEIVKAGNVITEMEDMVKEKAITGKSPHFLAFLNNVYAGPGQLGDLLGLGEKVEVELGHAGLRFYSLSEGALDHAERKVEETFKDVKYDISNFSMVPSELSEILKSKSADMNKSRCRVQSVVTVEGSVWLLGHAKEVDDLIEAVSQLILDQALVEGNVMLPFKDLTHCLKDLLQLHKFDYSGVSWYPIPSSSAPIIALEGPSCKVTDVRSRLNPFLASVVQSKMDIDLPGAVSYFQSPPGKENMLTVAYSHKCLLQLNVQPQNNLQNLGFAKYSLQDGLHVLVCQGDITKQCADALVNAANEQLDHAGGVAAALSRAGGPQVQKESTDIVKRNGEILTGTTVVTTGGNLSCKKLLHAVGPVMGQHGGRERELLKSAIRSSLNLAETMELKSIAIPCISSGVYGVPIPVCAEAIVSAIKEFGAHRGRSLRKITLIDQRDEVVQALVSACDHLLPGTRDSAPTEEDFQAVAASHDTARQEMGGASGGATGGATGGASAVCTEIVHGAIENQQVDVLVSPMIDQNPLSTRIGNELYQLVGPSLTTKFILEARGATQPGDIVVLENLPNLQCKAVIFVGMTRWDNNQHGDAVKALRKGIQRTLTSCESKGFTSVALPMLGTGAVLHFPQNVVNTVLLEEIDAFEKNRRRQSPFLCRIVVHPNNKEPSKALQAAQTGLQVNDKSVSIMIGAVKVEMILGNIINAGTDVIVNTTDFSSIQAGVSKAILTAAGPSVWPQVMAARKPSDLMFCSGPGQLACKQIIHACFNNNADTIRNNCKLILNHCENQGFRSVAFPAINTGGAGMGSSKACKAMLEGITAAVQATPKSLNLIRIVMLDQPVFRAFSMEVKGRPVQKETTTSKLIEKAKKKLLPNKRLSQSMSSLAPESLTSISFKPPPAEFTVTSCGSGVIQSLQKDLVQVLQKQLIKREVDVASFLRLNAIEEAAVLAKVKSLGISLELTKRQNAAAGNATKNEDVYVLRGLKEDVLSVLELINRAVQNSLSEDLQAKDEATVALTVQWSIKDDGGSWHELSLRDNYSLEEAYVDGQASVDVLNVTGRKIRVDVRGKIATDDWAGRIYEVKRVESQTALELPSQWEPMLDQIFKKVELQPSSDEYKNVARGFLNTAKCTIQKIERIQNLFLWHAFSICRLRILTKNGVANLGEHHLYHGTSAESCHCIERDRFDRSYAGKIGSRFGKGVYFAVTAAYSAGQFSPPDQSGLKRMYVARVLTGYYTKGDSSMSAAPARGPDPANCFDSLVDNMQTPTMYVIFHDDQAYPEYQITFT